MKNLLLIIVVTFTLVGTLCAGSHSVLVANNPETILIDESSVLPSWCAGSSCFAAPSVMAPGDGGSPMPVCQPGKSCNNDQLQLRAGDGGSPMPVCQPGKSCNNDQLIVTVVL